MESGEAHRPEAPKDTDVTPCALAEGWWLLERAWGGDHGDAPSCCDKCPVVMAGGRFGEVEIGEGHREHL